MSVPPHSLLDAAVDRSPVGMAVLDRDLRYVHINSSLAEINGLSVAAHIGRSIDEVLPPDIADSIRDVMRDVLTTGQSRHGIQLFRGEPVEGRGLEASYFPIGNGEVTAVGAVVLDVTDRDRALARARFLAQASAALGSSLDLEGTLRTVAELAVPQVADWSFVELVQPDGSITRAAWAHADPSLAEVVREYDKRYPLRPDDPAGSANVVRTGEPELVEHIPETFFDAVTGDPEQLRVLRAMGFRSYVIVPLVGRRRVLGALGLAYSTSGRPYGSHDLDMLQALADACALAIDNARLFGEQQATARTLQHSLLPPQLPEIAGVELAARYRPFGSGAEVGGDFYDVFPVPDGWAVALGDVTGKGTPAAAVTALLRHTLRIAAYLEREPGAALLRLDEALRRDQESPERATAFCGFLRPRPGAVEVTLASAGHPPPYVRRADGTVEQAVTPGTLLGALASDAPPTSRITLGPGDVLVLYTDGVTEARHGGGLLGETGLRMTLQDAPAGANGVVDAVERRAVEVQGGRPRDDIAVVAVAVPEG